MDTQQIAMIAPEVILADDNARFGLLDTRVESLKQAILEAGQVNDAIEVEALSEPVDGCTHRVTVGHYRHAAALALNKESAGIMLPCIVRNRVDEVERLKRQVSENNDRQNLTPMDSAVAIKAMIDAGIPRLDVRKAFARPNVKGKLVPASNSFLNMMMSFLDLPKKAQNMLHFGTLPVRKAYELTTKPKEKHQEILDEALDAREKEFEFEDRMEEKFNDAQRKAEEQESKQREAQAALEKAKAEAEDIQKDLAAKREASIEAFKAAKMAAEAEEKTKAEAALKAAEKQAQEAEKLAAAKTNEVKKLESKVKSSEELAKEKAERLKKAAAEKKKKVEGKPLNIQKAADKIAGKSGIQPLRSNEIKDVIQQMCLPTGDAPKVEAIGKAFMSAFFGLEGATQLTPPGQLLVELKKITGEYRAKQKSA